MPGVIWPPKVLKTQTDQNFAFSIVTLRVAFKKPFKNVMAVKDMVDAAVAKLPNTLTRGRLWVWTEEDPNDNGENSTVLIQLKFRILGYNDCPY